MIFGKVRCGFFQEVVLHFQFPVFPFDLAQPRAVTHGKRRFLAGMLTAVYANPVTQGTFVDTELLCHAGIGRDDSITIFTASSLNSGEKLFFGRGNYFTFPDIHPNGWTVRKPRGTSG